MAKNRTRGRRRRRWSQKNQLVQLVNSFALGTLADATLLADPLNGASDNEYRAISVKLNWSLENHTAGEGPIVVGIAHGDYTQAEIEAWMETTAMMTRGDLVATREIGQRLIRQVGMFSGNEVNEVLNDGKAITTKLNWVVAVGDVLDVWAYNMDGTALTTGTVVTQAGRLFLKWE